MIYSHNWTRCRRLVFPVIFLLPHWPPLSGVDTITIPEMDAKASTQHEEDVGRDEHCRSLTSYLMKSDKDVASLTLCATRLNLPISRRLVIVSRDVELNPGPRHVGQPPTFS